jgi:RNA polymerase sigma factor (sigma-70 family)
MTSQPTADTFVDSADLYNACGSSDRAVQAEAYRILWDYLYRIAFYLTARQPDQEALAQDCAQRALIRIHQQRRRCEEPKAFRTWSRRIVSNLTIDELRRRKRLQPLPDPAQEAQLDTEAAPNPELEIADSLTAVSLRHLLQTSPMSDRSRRVVIGRYLDDLDDNILAQTESELAGEDVHPSHVQVTRSKNISKLRQWPLLRRFLDESK